MLCTVGGGGKEGKGGGGGVEGGRRTVRKQKQKDEGFYRRSPVGEFFCEPISEPRKK